MSTEELLENRDRSHGDFREQFEAAQDLKGVCLNYVNYHYMDPVLREVIDMSLLKLSRILTGDWKFEDHWADLVGYDVLGLQRVRELQKEINDSLWVEEDEDYK